jgi:hypothetical protein
MRDEAWFHLSGHINSQNTDQKISVWCAVSGTHIIGSIFFDRTVNMEVYMNIFEEFCTQLTEEERVFSSSRTGRHATLLGCPYSEFMTSSLRNGWLAKICGRHVLLTLQHATIFSGDT